MENAGKFRLVYSVVTGRNDEGQKLAAAVGVAAIMISVAAGTVAPASAASNIKPFGQGETLLDPATGAPMITTRFTG